MFQSAIFHLAIPINNVAVAKQFYVDGLNCAVGRENKSAVIFDFFGTQLVGHVTQDQLVKRARIYPNHLGLILPTKLDWEKIRDRAQEQSLTFYQQPKLRFPNQPIEHHVFFLEDPFFNLLEFKYYSNSKVIFGGTESDLIGDVAEYDR